MSNEDNTMDNITPTDVQNSEHASSGTSGEQFIATSDDYPIDNLDLTQLFSTEVASTTQSHSCSDQEETQHTQTETESPSVADKEDEIVGYIHNLSPLKSGKYFDFQLQGKDKTVRGICFSPPKLKRFEEFSNTSSPVKVKKFRIDTQSNSEDYIMESDMSIEHFPDVNFQKQQMSTTMNISTVKTLCIGQLLTLKAKVAHLHVPKKVQSQNLLLQEAMLVDPSGTIKFVLWENFVGTIQQGSTYSFHDIRVKKDKFSSEIFLNTAKNGSKITDEEPFQEMLPVTAEMPSSTVTAELKGITKVACYLCCYKCNKKIEPTPSRIVHCSSCHFKQKQSACHNHWYAQVVFEEVNTKKKINLTLFQDAIKQAIQLNNCAEQESHLTELDIEEVLLTLPDTLMVTYHKQNRVVTKIAI